MKKVILCAAALIFTMGVFAQATSQNPDAPTQAKSLVTIGDPDGNMGESIQNGHNQKVWVQQAGTNQQVYTEQDNGLGTGDNRAWVMQTGNVGPDSGVENAAEVLQSGTYNQSYTKQEGDYNEALTRQGQNNAASSGNKALIRQGVAQHAENNHAGIDQDGHDNLAKTVQTYDKSEAWTKQVGQSNRSTINQDAGPDDTDGHEAEVDQMGENNESWIDQSGAGARNESVAYQLGENNDAVQTQVNWSGAGGAENNAMISQGDIFTGNTFLAPYFDLTAFDPSIDVGPMNADSHNALAIQNQLGSGNNADIRQFSDAPAGGNYAEQNQVGAGNNAFAVQNLFGISNGGDNYARQDQGGSDNIAGLSQAGLDHKAYQRQYGSENEALSTQRGSANAVNTYQLGHDNYAATLQHGFSNQALVVQNGGHTYTVKQSEGDLFSGNNWANINQTGPSGNFLDIDCEFPDPLSPPPSLTLGNIYIDEPCPDC